MQEIQPLDGVEAVRLERPGFSQERCVWSNRTIPLDEYAVSFHTKDGAHVLAWLKLSSVEQLCDALERVDDASDGAFEQAVNSTVDTAQGGHCCVCSESLRRGERAITFTNPVLNSTAAVHVDCAATLAEALDEVWMYADALLTTEL